MTPHDSVYTRLKASPIHGVGVFSILDISTGTYIFPQDDDELVWVEKSVVEQQPEPIRKLYCDFAVIKDGGKLFGVPANLTRMTSSWYLNEPEPLNQPNVGCDKDYRFYALRDIAAGEELTVDYKTYSELP